VGGAVNSVWILAFLMMSGATGASGSTGDALGRARSDEARLATIVALVEDDQFVEAEAALAQSGPVAHEDARWLNLLGLAVAGQGRPREAVTHYEAGLRLDPGLAALHRNLAITLVGLGMRGRAMTEFQQATELDAADTEAWLGLCNLQIRLRRHDGARYSLERLALLAPDDPRVWRARARIADENGDVDGARRAWRWLEEHDPSSGSARHLGDLLRTPQPELALDHYRNCIARDSTAVDCREQASRIALDLGRDQLAVDLSEPALLALSEAAYLNLLIAANNLANIQKIELWAEARAPGAAAGWGVLALALRADGRQADAVQAVQRGLALAEDADLYNLLGVLRVENGDLDSARRAWLRALEIDPGHGPAQANLDEHPESP
jgi:Flp pilus assembly protein TadD